MTPPSNAGGEGREALAQCPFCDEPTGELDQFHPTLRNEWRVICTTCDAWGPERATEATARAAWNRRPARENADDRAPALVEAAVAEMRERAAKVCDAIERRQDSDHGAANTGGAGECADAIRTLGTPSQEASNVG